jgi:hypothetical protein
MENNIYKTILIREREKHLSHFEPVTLAAKTLQVLRPIPRQVLIARFGLEGEKAQTLEEIGQKLNLTRERVRQIEKSAILEVKSARIPDYLEFLEVLHNTMQEAGGFIVEAELLKKLSANSSAEQIAALKYLLTIDDLVKVEKIGRVTTSWALKTAPHELIVPMCQALEEILAEKKKMLSRDELLKLAKNHKVFLKNKHLLNDAFVHTAMPACQNIGAGVEGKLGLVHWPEVRPKSLRDKIYWVLTKYRKPMHFKEVAAAIASEKFAKAKKFTVQAVHNELIADPKIVLVGRGIYALAEWGFEAGTVSQIIRSILEKSTRPLSQEEIIKSVLAQRQVKESTIIFNLRRSKEFIRTPEGYVLAKPLRVVPKALPQKVAK